MRRHAQSGFTLIELMIATAVLLVIMGAVFAQINKAQSRSTGELAKVDLTEGGREFLDQFTRDLHASGFPTQKMQTAVPALNLTSVAAGVVKISPTTVWLEGDVAGDGNIYTVQYVYVSSDANDSACPCIRRKQWLKQSGGLASQPATTTADTMVENVLDSATTGQNLFQFFTSTGSELTFGGSTSYDVENNLSTMQSLKMVKVNLTFRNAQKGETLSNGTVQYPQVSMATVAQVFNQPQ